MQNYQLPQGLRKITRAKGSMLRKLIWTVIMFVLLPNSSQAQDNVQPGEFIVEPPTLQNLGFEWFIDGDDNRNATVKVEFRIAGSG